MTTPTDTVVSGTISDDLAWLRHHLILLALVVLLVVGSVYGIESVIAKHDHENALEKQAIAQTLAQQNQQFQSQTQIQINTLVQQNTALQQQIGVLATAITTRDSQLRTQQAQVPQLTPDQLSVEWQKDIKNAGNIKPILPSGYQVDQAAAVASVQAIEAVPVLQQDIGDLQNSNKNLGVQLVNETAIYEDEKKAHASDNTANAAAIAAQNAKIKDITAQCRKSKLKWFGLGFLAGLFAAHSAGI
jgi:hypothetical protein